MDGYHFSSNDGPSNRDYTNEFTTDQIFESREDMLAWVRSVGLENGIVVVINKSANLKGRKLPKCILCCERGGSYKSGGLLSRILRRDTGTKKCECPFELRGIPIPPDGVQWGVKVSCGVHNHETAENIEGHEYPSRLKPAERQFVVEMANSTAPREILSILKQRDPSNTTDIRSVYNAIAEDKEAKRDGLNVTQYVLQQLIDKKYLHDIRTDEYTNEITDIIWVHRTSMQLCVNFSCVLVIDATYKTNEYRKPLVEIVGITSTNLTYSLMFAFLNNERADRLTWALSILKKWMVEYGASLPEVFVTDRDLALINAIEVCFPMAHQILCIWHINQAVMKNCSAALGDEFGDFNHSWQSLIHSSSTGTYQERWGIMLKKYRKYPRVLEYLANTWLRPYRDRFITAWTDTYLHLGSNSSQRAESAHSRLKKYLGGSSMSSLQTSFECIDKMLNNQFGAIKKSFEKSLNIPRHRHLKDPIFREIRCRVSLYALEEISKQLESAADAYPLLGCCGCHIKTTHGLPCMHDLNSCVTQNQAISFSSIHPHWTRLSIHADGFNHEGEQPDGVSRLVNVLEEMEPDMRSHMVSRFIDMADPAHSNIRGPSYNTEHGGRPTGRAEQSARRSFSCTEGRPMPRAEQSARHSFSCAEPSIVRGKGRGKARQTRRDRAEQEQDRYIPQLPSHFQQYMSHTTDVGADDHCGFRVIAAHIYGSEESWGQVRTDLFEEIFYNKEVYNALYPERGTADWLLHTLNCFSPQAPPDYWMDCMILGPVIATRYNVVLFTFDENVRSCYTHLPLRNPPVIAQERKEIAMARVNNNHFVQLFLNPYHPVPPIPLWWERNASYEARGWSVGYEAQILLWREIVYNNYG